MRQPRLYGLYRVVQLPGKKRKTYLREYPELAYTKAVAVRVFQNALLSAALGGEHVRELRPIQRGMLQ